MGASFEEYVFTIRLTRVIFFKTNHAAWIHKGQMTSKIQFFFVVVMVAIKCLNELERKIRFKSLWDFTMLKKRLRNDGPSYLDPLSVIAISMSAVAIRKTESRCNACPLRLGIIY